MGNFGGNVQQWANLFKDIMQDHPEAVNAVFDPEAEEAASQLEFADTEKSEKPFEELFEQVEQEFKTTDAEEESAESMEGMEKLVSGAKQLENKPRAAAMTAEEIERRKMLRDYVANEVASFTEETTETIHKLMETPDNRELAARLQDSLKSLKDIGQIHYYPAVEQTADTLLQLFNQLQQQSQSFTSEEKPALDGIFGILPIYIDAAVENVDNDYHNEIQQELSELRSRLFRDEPVSDVKAAETLEAAFQDVVGRYARQINEYLAARGNGASSQPLSPIFENLTYWSDLLVSPEAAATINHMQQLLNRETLTKLSGEDRQVVSDIVSSWESDFVNTSSDLWKNYNSKLAELLQNLDAVSAAEALEAFQQVTNSQLSQFVKEVKSDAVSAAACVQEKLPNFLANLQINSAIVKNDGVENLCQTLSSELNNVDTRQLAEKPSVKDQLAAFLENLQTNLNSLPHSLESDSLVAQFKNLAAVESAALEALL